MKQELHKTKFSSWALIALLLVLGTDTFGQALNDYRTAGSGEWNSLTTWQRWNGSAWVTPTAVQGTPTNAVNVVTILNTHTVTVTANVSIDQATIDAGGQVTVNSGVTLTIANGTGTDLTVNGTVQNAGTMTITGTVNMNSGSVYRHNQTAGTIITNTTWSANSTLEFSNGGNTTPGNLPGGTTFGGRLVVTNNTNVTLNGSAGTVTLNIGNGTGDDLVIASGSTLTSNAGVDNIILAANATANISGTFTTNDIYNTSAANTVTTVNGTFINSGTITGATATKFVVASTGTYQHAQNGGTVPTATWSSGSTCSITGMTGNYPAGMGQTFSNVLFNSNINFGDVTMGTNLTCSGNLTISNSGTDDFRLTNTAADLVISVGGAFSITSGNFILVSDDGDGTLNVTGNFTQSGGTFTMNNDNGTGSPALNVTGNFTKTGGTFNHRTGTLTAETSIVTIGGNFSHSGGTYNLSNDAGVGTLNIAGNFSITAGTITESAGGSGSIIFNGTGTQTYTSGATVSNTINFTVNTGSTLQLASPTAAVTGGGTFTLQTNATLGITSPDGIRATAVEIGGNIGNIQVTGTRSFNAGANYLYNGTAAQVTGSGFPNNLTGDIIINNPGNTVTLSAGRTIANGGTINLTAGTFAAGTNLSISSTAEIVRSGGDMTITTLGGTGQYNLTYTGASKTTSGEIVGGRTTISLLPLVYRLNNVTVNLDASQNLTIDLNGVTVGSLTGYGMSGVLTLTNGLINTGLNNGLLMADGASCPGGGSATSYINGPVIKTGTTALIFPVGNGGFYLPIGVSGANNNINAALPAINYLLVQANNANPVTAIGSTLNPGPPALTSISQCYYWDISKALGVGSGNLFVWPSTDNLVTCGVSPSLNPANFVVAHFEGGAWTSYGRNSTATVNGSNFFSQSTGISSFSPFTIGSTDAALPVELTDFTATPNGNAVQLNWKTASEQHNAYFEVERSADGANFSSIGKVNGAGTSTQILNYGFADKSPLAGLNYYRLRQVDLDGKFSYSAVIAVSLSTPVLDLKVYPNPANTYLVAESAAFGNKRVSVQVIDNQGRILINRMVQAPANGRIRLEFGNTIQASGQYWLRLASGMDVQQSRVMITRQ